MIEAYFQNKVVNISDSNYFFTVHEKPFHCKLKGFIEKSINGIEKLTMKYSKFKVDFFIKEASRRDIRQTNLIGDSWDKPEKKTPLLGVKASDTLEKIFPGLIIEKFGVVESLKNNLDYIFPLSFKDKFLYVAQWQNFIANYYGSKAVVIGKNLPINFITQGKEIIFGSKFKYTPEYNLKFFLKEETYDAVEIWGYKNGDISLFDTCEFGTAISIERNFNGLAQEWKAIFIKI